MLFGKYVSPWRQKLAWCKFDTSSTNHHCVLTQKGILVPDYSFLVSLWNFWLWIISDKEMHYELYSTFLFRSSTGYLAVGSWEEMAFFFFSSLLFFLKSPSVEKLLQIPPQTLLLPADGGDLLTPNPLTLKYTFTPNLYKYPWGENGFHSLSEK